MCWLERSGRLRRVSPLLLVSLLGALVGCGRFTDTVPLLLQPDEYELYGSQQVVQRFVCHHAGLAKVSVLLQASPGAGEVVLRLREDAEHAADVATVVTEPPASEAPAYQLFRVPVQDKANGKSFLLLLEAPDATSAAPVLLPYGHGAPGELDLWLDGELLVGSRLSFQLHYDPLYIARDLVRQALTFGLRSLWLLFLGTLFFLLPGGALVAWLLREGDWAERIVIALGLSVAVHALLVYATMTGLRLGRAATYGFLALCAALTGLRWWMDGHPLPSFRGTWARLKADPTPAVLVAVFVLVVGVRAFVVRDLVAPMWGDGYHHTVISQLIVDNGGLFDSWEPYAPLTTFTYHFGFHANVALYHWLSGESVVQSTIWVGQMINALAVLALYPLVLKVSGGSRWAGVVAVLVAGLLSPMPMYYLNWSRYTQLAGQVILPVLMWLTWELVAARRWNWRLAALVTAECVGLGVTHYRVVPLYGLFVLPLLVRVWARRRAERHALVRTVGPLALVALLTALLFLPWGWNVLGARIPKIGAYLLQEGNESEFQRTVYNAVGDPSTYVPVALLVLSAGALVWQARQRRFAAWLMPIWLGGMAVVANPYLVGLPGTGLVSNFAVLIMLYIPVAVLVGLGVGVLAEWLWQHKSPTLVVVSALFVSVVAGWGVIQRMADLEPGHVMVTEADVEAMAWIQENTSPDASFLVNGFLAFDRSAAVGADGGWWIPYLAHRRSSVPPLVYGMELAVDPDYPIVVRDRYLLLEQLALASREGAQVLRDLGYSHVFVGQRDGRVGSPAEPLLDPQTLSVSPAYRLAYRRAGVWILEILPGDGSNASGD